MVTVANKSDGYYEILKQSCIRNGCKLITLGFGEKWEGFGEKWEGFVWKYKKLREFLNTIKLDDIVVFVDHIDIFMERYKKFDKSIILPDRRSNISA